MAAKKKNPTPWKWVNTGPNSWVAGKGRLSCEAWRDSETNAWHGTALITSGTKGDRSEICVYTKRPYAKVEAAQRATEEAMARLVAGINKDFNK